MEVSENTRPAGRTWTVLHTKMIAQINLPDLFVRQYLFCRTCGNDVPLANDIGFFTDIEGVAYIVVGYQHANAPVAQVIDNLLDIADGNGVDTGEGLVE